ncbi:ribonuclease III [Lactiplantibacillus sp. WILCCON 0030]|uniref:Ribonuclease 3 n=1 Tax=Lactiplantibacillus brownii TaxID=3069269 RepID=A0ABU1A8M8_9LACO|nr:ribonuclease III [Lactiplantibacillus brownii]MDQ7937284.1 ribonuclease III [Lactiplantibacillus brownii]
MITELAAMLEARFGIKFKDPALLAEAFTQASYVNEHQDQKLKYYERVEFLGDAVLELAVSEYLYKRYKDMPQGKLTRLRAAMVCEDSFASFARECDFPQYIRLGKGEQKAKAWERDSLLCDIFESFVGALYLDQGREPVLKFVHQVIFPKLDEGRFDGVFDYKTTLQEYLQQDGDVEIDYQLVEQDGPANERSYEIAVSANGRQIGEGRGHSKKEAEQSAARQAYTQLQQRHD